jgi:hypothetical protein
VEFLLTFRRTIDARSQWRLTYQIALKQVPVLIDAKGLLVSRTLAVIHCCLGTLDWQVLRRVEIQHASDDLPTDPVKINITGENDITAGLPILRLFSMVRNEVEALVRCWSRPYHVVHQRNSSSDVVECSENNLASLRGILTSCGYQY